MFSSHLCKEYCQKITTENTEKYLKLFAYHDPRSFLCALCGFIFPLAFHKTFEITMQRLFL